MKARTQNKKLKFDKLFPFTWNFLVSYVREIEFGATLDESIESFIDTSRHNQQKLLIHEIDQISNLEVLPLIDFSNASNYQFTNDSLRKFLELTKKQLSKSLDTIS